MANERLDPGTTRALYEALCKRIGHDAVARITGKAISTVRAYCDPGNRRQVPVGDQRVLGRHMFLNHGVTMDWPDLRPDHWPPGKTPESHKRGMDDCEATGYQWPRRAAH